MLIPSFICLTVLCLIAGWSLGKRHRLSSRKEPKLLEDKKTDPLEEARAAAEPYFRILDREYAGSEKKVFHTHTLEIVFERFGFPRKTTLFGPEKDAFGLRFVASFGFMVEKSRYERSWSGDGKGYIRVPVFCQDCGKHAVCLNAFKDNTSQPKWHLIAEACLTCHKINATQYLEKEDVEWVRTCEAAIKKLSVKADGPYRMSA